MTGETYQDVLATAKRMPPAAQAELVADILRNLQSWLRTGKNLEDGVTLELMTELSASELRVLADAVVAPGGQVRLQELLEKNRAGGLNVEEVAILDDLLAQVDQVALLKARAQYTLRRTGAAEEPPA
jgi:hypothetical protein